MRERLAAIRKARGAAAVSPAPRYDAIGRSYVATRGEDPRIAAALWGCARRRGLGAQRRRGHGGTTSRGTGARCSRSSRRR